MRHPKGLIPIVVVIFITIIAAGIVGAAWYYEENKEEVVENNNLSDDVTKLETTNWQTYTNEVWGLSFKYPETWSVLTDNLPEYIPERVHSLNQGYLLLGINDSADGIPSEFMQLWISPDGWSPITDSRPPFTIHKQINVDINDGVFAITEETKNSLPEKDDSVENTYIISVSSPKLEDDRRFIMYYGGVSSKADTISQITTTSLGTYMIFQPNGGVKPALDELSSDSKTEFWLLSQNNELQSLNIVTGEIKDWLDFSEQGGSKENLITSPQGDKIAITKKNDGDSSQELILSDINKSMEKILASGVICIDFSCPSEQSIRGGSFYNSGLYYTYFNEGNSMLYNVSTGEKQTILSDNEDYIIPSLSPQGTYIYYFLEGSMYYAKRTELNFKEISIGDPTQELAYFSPDEKFFIVFNHEKDGLNDLPITGMNLYESENGILLDSINRIEGYNNYYIQPVNNSPLFWLTDTQFIYRHFKAPHKINITNNIYELGEFPATTVHEEIRDDHSNDVYLINKLEYITQNGNKLLRVNIDSNIAEIISTLDSRQQLLGVK